MDEHDWLAERFEQYRPHLRAVAYRLLGSLSEAEDAVQDAWLRLSRSGTSGVENLGGWLTTVVARVCLNMLQARTSRREEPLGAHGPAPMVSGADVTNPEHEVLLADAVGPALLVVLDTLPPPERAAQLALIRGVAGAVWAPGGQPRVVSDVRISRGKIVAIDLIADPARLRQLDLAVLNDVGPVGVDRGLQ